MGSKKILLCTGFYQFFKDKVDPNIQLTYRSPMGTDEPIEIKIEEDKVIFSGKFGQYMRNTFRMEFQTNKVTVNTTYVFDHYDVDVYENKNTNLILQGKQPCENNQYYKKVDLYMNKVEKETDGPIPEKELKELIRFVFQIIEKCAPRAVQEAYIKHSPQNAYFAMKQACGQRLHGSKYECMTQGNLLATLFNTHIAPLAHMERLSEEDIRKHEAVSKYLG